MLQVVDYQVHASLRQNTKHPWPSLRSSVAVAEDNYVVIHKIILDRGDFQCILQRFQVFFCYAPIAQLIIIACLDVNCQWALWMYL